MRKRILTEDDLRDIESSISDIDLSDYLKKKPENLGRTNFNDVKDPGFYRIFHSSTSPLKHTIPYYLIVHNYSGNVVQVAHTLTGNEDSKNRAFTRTYYNGWDSWKELTNTEIEKEIAEVKQSGVESNKILVDALNSKGVSASTSDSIKTNVGKVKDIQVGDYSIGDYVRYRDLDILSTNNGVPPLIFKQDITNPTAVAMSDKYIYVGTSSGRLIKYNYSGTKMWDKSISSSEITAMDIDRDKEYIYVGFKNLKFQKINTTGTIVWTRDMGDAYKHNRITDIKYYDGYIYTADTSDIQKTSESGTVEWKVRPHGVNDNINQISVDKDGNIYKASETYVPQKISGKTGKVLVSHGGLGQYAVAVTNGANGGVFMMRDGNFYKKHSNTLEDEFTTDLSQVIPSTITKLIADENDNDVYGISGNYIVKLSRWGGIKWRAWQGDIIKDIDSCNNLIACVNEDALQLLAVMPISGVYLK